MDANDSIYWPLDLMVANGIVAAGLNDETQIVGNTLIGLGYSGTDGLVAMPQH